MQKNSPRMSNLPYPSPQPSSHGRHHPSPYPTIAEQLMAFGNSGRRRQHKMDSSRSPSPLNTSTEAVSVISSSDQSSPSPVFVKTERAVSPPISLFPPPPTVTDGGGCGPFSLLRGAEERGESPTRSHHYAAYESQGRGSSSLSAGSHSPVLEPPSSLPSPTAMPKMSFSISGNLYNCPAAVSPMENANSSSSSGSSEGANRLLPHLLLDPAALYRLSPLLAMHPLLLASTAASPLFRHQMTDFRQQLDLLAERRAIFERLKAEAEARAASASPPPPSAATSVNASQQPEIPIDLSCK